MVKVYQGVAIKVKASLLLQPNTHPIEIHVLAHFSTAANTVEARLALSPEVACCED